MTGRNIPGQASAQVADLALEAAAQLLTLANQLRAIDGSSEDQEQP